MAQYLIGNRTSSRTFFGIATLLFAISTALTIAWCGSMSAMEGMAMPGGWIMSMAWMRMPEQSWADAAVEFLGMWIAMMMAMMLPALTVQLWRYREELGGIDKARSNWLTALAGLGYFGVWGAVGLTVFPLGTVLATLAMQWPELARAVPLAVGAIVVLAGALQFSAWKAHHLACCRAHPECGRALSADGSSAWRYGVRLGIHCNYCCAGPTAILLVIGVMDLRAMAIVAVAITAERLAPAGERVARAIGIVAVAVGLLLILRAAWFA